MVKPTESTSSFNLWMEPWIRLECRDGAIARFGIEETLLRAQEFTAIYEQSPLVVVGIHRLLAAILQHAFAPTEGKELKALWRAGHFPTGAIKDFAQRYGDRFDLFAEATPFLQSADLDLEPGKEGKPKTVAYLAPEIPAGTAVTHFRHGSEAAQLFCPTCAAGCLVTVPAFATSGGAGIRPSINGVPPLYMIPGGTNLFESLAASLLLPDFRPAVASDEDTPWWARGRGVVVRGKELRRVGYLQSLTFPARRVRLHPERVDAECTRCGERTEWGVRTMVFEMGECRPKDAAFWQDPFAAYRWPLDKGKKTPTPIRPVAGRAAWREFANLFLQSPPSTDKGTRPMLRPRALDQMAELRLGADRPTYPFRCIGLRTDMKAKVFELVDAGFDVPPPLLRDETAGSFVNDAVQFAADCAGIIAYVFKAEFGKWSKQERHRALKARMAAEFWTGLAAPFRHFVLALADARARSQTLIEWTNEVVACAGDAFVAAAAAVGDDGGSLRKRAEGERRCAVLLRQRKEKLTHE